MRACVCVVAQQEAQLLVTWSRSLQAVYCGGELVDALLRSGAHAYVEFKVVEANASAARGALRAVPGSRADVFTSRELSALDKRALMRALKAAAEPLQAQDGAAAAGGVALFSDGSAPFVDALAAAGLSEELRGVVLHALALCDDAGVICGQGVAALQRCASPAVSGARGLGRMSPHVLCGSQVLVVAGALRRAGRLSGSSLRRGRAAASLLPHRGAPAARALA